MTEETSQTLYTAGKTREITPALPRPHDITPCKTQEAKEICLRFGFKTTNDNSMVSLDKEHLKFSDHRCPSVFSLSAIIDVECVIYTEALIFSFGAYSKH